MKPILTTTAIVALLAGPALAQTTETQNGQSPFVNTEVGETSVAFDLRASDLIGKNLYTSETPYDGEVADAASDDWNNVGEISDVLMNRDGSTEAVLLDIGGFLGLGARTVAVSLDQLQFVRDGEEGDDYFVVANATQEQLENAPEFDVDMTNTWSTADTTGAGTTTTMNDGTTNDGAMTESTGEAADTEATGGMTDTTDTDRAMATDVEMVEVGLDTINTDDLIGARVYDNQDEWIGEVSELVVTTEGEISEIVMDIGGFLGMGEKRVALPLDGVTFMQGAEDDTALLVRADMSEDALESAPEWTADEG